MSINIGLDIGNKNLKVGSEKGCHEIPVAYREKDSYWYENEPIGEGMEKVKYKDRYFLVGIQGKSGLPQNKGDKNIRDISNMFKLVGLARELRLRNETEGAFNVVTGTPLNDYNAFKDDYMDLMISKEDEIIQLNKVDYKIRVEDAIISKQGAVVAPTLNNWGDGHLLLIDLGGGTLDVAYFVKGTQDRYLTIDLPLNELLEELGNDLNSYGLGLPRPDELDSSYLDTIEDVVLNGEYMNIRDIEIEGNRVPIKDYCSQWLQPRVDSIIADIKIRLNMSNTVAQNSQVHYLGGGAKLLRDQLINNQTFKNKTITSEPMFDNVKAYYTIAKASW